MCTSKDEGGQRCYQDALRRADAAEQTYFNDPTFPNRDKIVQALIDLASTERGGVEVAKIQHSGRWVPGQPGPERWQEIIDRSAALRKEKSAIRYEHHAALHRQAAYDAQVAVGTCPTNATRPDELQRWLADSDVDYRTAEHRAFHESAVAKFADSKITGPTPTRLLQPYDRLDPSNPLPRSEQERIAFAEQWRVIARSARTNQYTAQALAHSRKGNLYAHDQNISERRGLVAIRPTDVGYVGRATNKNGTTEDVYVARRLPDGRVLTLSLSNAEPTPEAEVTITEMKWEYRDTSTMTRSANTKYDSLILVGNDDFPEQVLLQTPREVAQNAFADWYRNNKARFDKVAITNGM